MSVHPITPAALRAYAIKKGWKATGHGIGHFSDFYCREDDLYSESILLPRDPTLVGYDVAVAEVLQVFADVHHEGDRNEAFRVILGRPKWREQYDDPEQAGQHDPKARLDEVAVATANMSVHIEAMSEEEYCLIIRAHGETRIYNLSGGKKERVNLWRYE